MRKERAAMKESPGLIFRETLIQSMPRVFTTDLTHLFGEKPRDTTRLG
jgi:hypothetical protein